MIDYMYETLTKRVRFIFNDLALYNLFEAEISGQLSDGHWENSTMDVRFWWMPSTSFAEGDFQGVETTDASIAWHYNDGRKPKFANNELIACVGSRMLAYIVAGKCGYKVNYDNRRLCEEMWQMIGVNITVEDALDRFKNLTGYAKDLYSLERAKMTEEQFIDLYKKMAAFIDRELNGQNDCLPYSKGRKLVKNSLVKLNEVLTNVRCVKNFVEA